MTDATVESRNLRSVKTFVELWPMCPYVTDRKVDDGDADADAKHNFSKTWWCFRCHCMLGSNTMSVTTHASEGFIFQVLAKLPKDPSH